MVISDCHDQPSGWIDYLGSDCDMYISENWCTPDGKTGSSWDSEWGPLEAYTTDGPSNADPSVPQLNPTIVCCGCGGGSKKGVMLSMANTA